MYTVNTFKNIYYERYIFLMSCANFGQAEICLLDMLYKIYNLCLHLKFSKTCMADFQTSLQKLWKEVQITDYNLCKWYRKQ